MGFQVRYGLSALDRFGNHFVVAQATVSVVRLQRAVQNQAGLRTPRRSNHGARATP